MALHAMSSTDYTTLNEALLEPLRPDHRIGFLTGPDPSFHTYTSLRERAVRVLGDLQGRGAQAGDFLVLHSGDIQAFIEIFWACLLGGIVPVPVSHGGSDDHQRKVLRVMQLFDAPWLVTEVQGLERLQAFREADGEAWPELSDRVLSLDDLSGESGEGVLAAPKPEDLAYVQFSSGSTRLPKGIQLTHANLVANVDAIIRGIELEPEDRPHFWMPLTHDMGLIGGHLTPFLRGTHHTIIPTERFVRRPLTWLLEAATYGVTVTGGPNFAYQHTLRAYKPERFEGVDLSAIRVIFNGAEPISYELVKRFLDTFAAHGLRAESMFPVYGLAEGSLCVSMPPLLSGLRRTETDRTHLGVGDQVRLPEDDASRLNLVPLGAAVAHCEFRIGDGEGLPEGTVGPVWIRGTNVTGQIRTDEGVHDPRVDGWYDTGDLGFVKDGELHICGRVKEMAIVNGQNVYPHDVEAVAAELDEIELGKVVAAGVRDPDTEREGLALFVVWRKDDDAFQALADRLRERVVSRTGIAVARIVPVKNIPKTTSGKLQRVKLAQDYERSLVEARREAEALSQTADMAALSDTDEVAVPGSIPPSSD